MALYGAEDKDRHNQAQLMLILAIWFSVILWLNASGVLLKSLVILPILCLVVVFCGRDFCESLVMKIVGAILRRSKMGERNSDYGHF